MECANFLRSVIVKVALTSVLVIMTFRLFNAILLQSLFHLPEQVNYYDVNSQQYDLSQCLLIFTVIT
jgi:hypothetical protein